MMVGAYRPGRGIGLEFCESLDDIRAVLIHERSHVYLTENTTLGAAALVCGSRKANHDLTVLPDAAGRRPTFLPPYLRYFQEASSWDQEGVATACETIHWPRITGRYRSERLASRPASYVEAAQEYLGVVSEIASAHVRDTDLRSFVEASLVCAFGLAVLSPAVEPGFYQAAGDGVVDGFERPLAEVPSRKRAVFGITSGEIGHALAKLIAEHLVFVEARFSDLDAALLERFPGDSNAALRRSLASMSDNPQVKSRLATLISDSPQFREQVATAIARQAGVPFGRIDEAEVAAQGLAISPRQGRLFWSDVGQQAEMRRPAQCQLASESLSGLASELPRLSQLVRNAGVIIIPEFCGPFLANDAVLLSHVFMPNGEHEFSMVTVVPFAMLGTANRIARQLTELLLEHAEAGAAQCFGVVAPYSSRESSLAAAIDGLALVQTPHFAVPSELFKGETLIGVRDGNGLVRQQLADGGATWVVVPCLHSSLPPIRNVIDSCVAWILANGANANAVWLHHTN